MGRRYWKRCLGISVLLLMVGGAAMAETGTGLQPDLEAEVRADTVNRQEAGGAIDVESAAVKDDAFYVQFLQNLHQGNSMAYADGYYYFRSQAQDYSLCRSKGAGMPVEVVADQTPGSIYVEGEQIYFLNVSDGRTLYRVGTDGSGLEKLSGISMQELVVVEGKVYFRSVYDQEYDPFYQLTQEEAEGDRYLYSMGLDGSGCTLLAPETCMEFVSDGEWLYYLTKQEGEGVALNRCGLDGEDKEKIAVSQTGIWNILPYRGSVYGMDYGQDKRLVRLWPDGTEETLAYDVLGYTISEGCAYLMSEEEIRRVDLESGEEGLAVKKRPEENGRKDTYPWYAGSYNRGIFLVNGQWLARYFESPEKGVLWHIWDNKKREFIVFEDMETIPEQELVWDTSLSKECNYFYPGWEGESPEEYLDADKELHYEESYGVWEDGTDYGNFSITLPKFGPGLSCYEELNRKMDGLMELAMEDKESLFREIEEAQKEQEYCYNWWLRHEYSHLYVGEKHISILYYRNGYSGGIREWMEPMPMIFDRETGELLLMDDLFTVERKYYMKRLTGAIYKYCERMGYDWWNEPFDNNVLAKNLGELGCYLTPDGLALCYERYAIQMGASGSPAFGVPYERFADIFR